MNKPLSSKKHIGALIAFAIALSSFMAVAATELAEKTQDKADKATEAATKDTVHKKKGDLPNTTETGDYLEPQSTEKKVKSKIDKTYPLDQAAEALDYISQGKHRGKVVIKIK